MGTRLGVGVLLLLALAVGLVANEPVRRLETGDQVRLVTHDPTMGRIYRIEADGAILLPGVGTVLLAGQEMAAAQDRVRYALLVAGLDLGDAVLERVLRSDAPIRATGTLENPLELTPAEGLRLADVLRAARPTEAAAVEGVVILGQGGERLVVNFEAGENPEVRAGDHIYVPVSDRVREVFVLGGVAQPGAIPFVADMTAADALDSAGGFARFAETEAIEVVRGDRMVARLSHPETTRGFTLRAGDVVRVPMRQVRQFVGVDGAVRAPTVVDYTDDLTLLKAVNAAGGALPNADLARVLIVRYTGGTARRLIHDLGAILRGQMSDLPLQPGDSIFVPTRRR